MGESCRGESRRSPGRRVGGAAAAAGHGGGGGDGDLLVRRVRVTGRQRDGDGLA